VVIASPVRLFRFASPIEWLYLLSSLALTWRYGWLLDDAFIYFRYVDNWVLLERGLVYNAGEFVEGFTSPLWTLVLGALRLTRLDYWTLILATSLGFATAFWWLAVWIHRHLKPLGPVVNLPLAVCSTHYGVLSYFSSGLESPLVQISALTFAALAVRPDHRGLATLAGLAPLVRPELALPWAVYVLVLYRKRARFPVWLCLSGLLSQGGWLAFRVYYYADLLPNTYYLKDETNFEQGARYLSNSTESHGWLFAVIALGVLYWYSEHTKTVKAGAASAESLRVMAPGCRALMVCAAAASGLYVWRSGGDMLYYRLAAFPLLLLLMASGGVAEALLARLPLPRRAWAYPSLGLLTLVASLLGYPAQLKAHPLTFGPGARDTMQKVDGISDASWHRHHPDLRYTRERGDQDALLQSRYARGAAGERGEREILTDGWCVRLYFAFDSYVVHWWGLTEPILARVRVPSERPGHKHGLIALAHDLSAVHRSQPGAPGQGMFQRAVLEGRAASWIAQNIASITLIERKMYNRHRVWENVQLALTRAPPIAIPSVQPN
jgi:hypothetical protein